MRGRDLLSISDLNAEELERVLDTALELKAEWREAHPLPRKARGRPSALEALKEEALRQAQGERGEERVEGHAFGESLWRVVRQSHAGRGEDEQAETLREAQGERGDPQDGPREGDTLREPQGERGGPQAPGDPDEGDALRQAQGEPIPQRLAGKTLALVFEKPSLRTRVSFDVGMRQLGGDCVYVSPAEVGLGTREPVEDVARVLSRYVDCIAARTFEHETVEALAQWSEAPVINALSAGEHPCQALADFLTILEKKDRLRGVKLAYVGDGNNVARSLCLGAAVLGMEFRIAAPRGFELDKSTLSGSRVLGGATGGSVAQTNDPREAVSGADVVYTDVWASMGQEDEAASRAKAFAGYQVDVSLMAMAKGDAIFMHDLPAHRGEEVAAEVIDGESSVVWEQAENRMHAQKAVLALIMGGEV